jgi:hypothetical protein
MLMSRAFMFAAAASLAAGAPASAQLAPIDPNSSYAAPAATPPPAAPESQDGYETVDGGNQDPYAPPAPREAPAPGQPAPAQSAPTQSTLTAPTDTVAKDDVFAAAEGVFGKGAKGLAGMLEKILKEQGEPTAYIAGHEAGGAFILGVRYGSGTMRHRIEGDRPVYWTGPSVGFDAGADANKVFVLVYNLHDTQDLFRRFPAAEGNAYVVGGFTGSYLRRGDVVLIPIRLGVGLRLGLNAGYMKFSEKNQWLPF